MEIGVYSQYYRTGTSVRQLEIDECLRRNLNHPGISLLVLLRESDAPPVQKGTVPVEEESRDERITYADWLRWVKRQVSVISLPLTLFNQGRANLHLNDYPNWTREVWGVRANAELPESLLYASSVSACDKTGARIYGGVNTVHPSLAPDEDAELEFTLWSTIVTAARGCWASSRR